MLTGSKLSKLAVGGLLVVLFAFRIWQSSGCLNFRSFVFDSRRITATVESSRQYETNPNGLLSRLEHNKLTVAPYEFGLNLSALLDPRYLLDLIGPAGLAAALIAIYSIVSQRRRAGLLFLAILLTAQILATLFTSSKTDMLILCVLWFLLGFWSLNFWSLTKKRLFVFLLLWLYSLWFFFISWQLPLLCNEILFK